MSSMTPARLRVEYKENPLGLDAACPRLGWIVEAEGRDQHQTAYQILVASTREQLDADKGDLWDTGRVASGRSTHIAYEGAPLASRMECFWKVRAWNQDGEEGPFSKPASWTMGLLDPDEWQADWIGFDAPHPVKTGQPDPPEIAGCAWMALPEPEEPESGPVPERVYRGSITLPDDKSIALAQCVLSSGGQFRLFVNGTETGASDGRFWAWRRPTLIDITELLQPGENVLAIRAIHGESPMPPGVIGVAEVAFEDGATARFALDDSWRGCEKPGPGWEAAGFEDGAWSSLVQIAKAGEKPYGEFEPTVMEIPPCPYLRRGFDLDKPVAAATAYVSALGACELRVNGTRVGDDRFNPGWTDFEKRVYYRTYDVTELVKEGANAVGAILGHGWYSGYLGFEIANRAKLGRQPRARIQVEVTYADGSVETIASDGTWRANHGALVGSDFYMGEQYDARLEVRAWDAPAFDDAAWQPVVVGAPISPAMQAHPGVPVRAIEELSARAVTEPQPGAYIFDLGQNLVGHARLRVSGEAGTKITLRFGEFLKPDGTLYVENLRGARCIDEYWLKGGGVETWEPVFTFHGFRYVEVTGYPGTPDLDAITGVVVHSAMPRTGAFACSHDLINQLQHNILWGQKGNFLEVPTDCPQRDERLGWMGDAQVFCRTACYNMDTAAFFTKWVQDVEDGQLPSGAFPDVAPRVVVTGDGSPAWAEAGVIVPWTLYQCYGDTGILAKHYEAMRRFMIFLGLDNPDHIRRSHLNNNYGDWLNKDDNTPKELIATAFYAHAAGLMAKIARILGKADDAREYGELAQAIKTAFVKTFVNKAGRVQGDTQTCYVLALHFDLLPDGELRRLAARRLVERIEQANGHLTTGFVGCPYLLDALADNGYLDEAYQLLTNTTYPSWLYSVVHGATTIWERWDGWTDHTGFQDPGMNSFNHYAYGSVGDWMYRNLAGIDLDPDRPAYKHIVIRPRPAGGFTHARGEYHSIHGRIVSDWRLEDGVFTLDLEVPPNTRATVHIPTAPPNGVTESGTPASKADGVRFKARENSVVVYEVGSGSYSFVSRVQQQQTTRGMS